MTNPKLSSLMTQAQPEMKGSKSIIAEYQFIQSDFLTQRAQ